MRNTLLKDIVLNMQPECPEEYIRSGGPEAIICDREGLKYIAAEPLVRGIEYLYDLNIQTEACGRNGDSEMGISCNYETLDENNKAIVDKYLERKGKSIVLPTNDHVQSIRFRISIDVDDEVDTVESAEARLMDEIYSIGLQKQDVLFGTKTIEGERAFLLLLGLNLTDEEMIKDQESLGRVIDGETIWLSQELYNKHLEYIAEKDADENMLCKEEN